MCAGFVVHNAQPDYVILKQWLAQGPSRLPPAPFHYIGVAGFVMDPQQRVLAVREKSGPAAAAGIWKMPGGLVDRGEDISTAAVREVREETGLETEFVCVSSIQEIHHTPASGFVREGLSDLYCVCVLRAMDPAQPLLPCPDEIEACEWQPLAVVR